MDIDLRLPSEDHEKEEEESNGIVHMLVTEEKPQNLDGLNENMIDIEENIQIEDTTDMNTPLIHDMVDPEEDVLLEPLPGMEFESHSEAYAFYQEYSRSMGFNTAIQNSRRSKTSREFIDAKFACSRYGTKREYEKSLNRPRSRQGQHNQDPESATGRRSCSKTDCKASMHVKRRPDGKWIIHRFERDHNHELLPAQAVSEQTRKMYAAMARQFAEYKNEVGLKSDSKSPFDKTRNLSIDARETNTLLDFFTDMQISNPNFFYAMDSSEDQRFKNFLWIDAKSRYDYMNFNDVVSFDTSYVRNKYKMPLALFIGVNHHYQFMLLGCAFLSDETEATFSWVIKTWLRALNGQAPKIIITEQDKNMKSVISEFLPSSLHYFSLWNIMQKVSETFNQIIKSNEKFLTKFEKCVYRSCTEDEFEKRWEKLVDRFDLKEHELIQTLYNDREKWVSTFMKDTCLVGMSSITRSDSVNSFFDKYVHKKTTIHEFLKQYEAILQDRYEEEAKQDSDTWNKQPSLKSPSPFEKFSAQTFTNSIFKKFQNEVLGAVACIPKREKQDDMSLTFNVQDYEKGQDFIVNLNEVTSEVFCMCHLFEFKGILCRHAMIVLQICGISTIPSKYILKRWTKDAKNRGFITEGGSLDHVHQSRIQRYNDLCQKAIKLSEEGSFSQDSYNIALRALDDAFSNCMSVNNSNKSLSEHGTSNSNTPGLLCIEEDDQSRSMNKSNKKKNPTKRRKAPSETDVMNVGSQEGLQQMEKLNSRQAALEGYFGPQQGVQGMVQLNLMGPARDNYYTNQHTIQGLGQLNTIAPTHENYYAPQPTMHGLGQMDFFRNPGFTYGIREEPNVRSGQLHDDASRHA